MRNFAQGVCQSDGSCKCDPGWTSLPYDGPWFRNAPAFFTLLIILAVKHQLARLIVGAAACPGVGFSIFFRPQRPYVDQRGMDAALPTIISSKRLVRLSVAAAAFLHTASCTLCIPRSAFHGGEGGVDKRTTSWGGSVLPYRGKYWMFAAEMAQRACRCAHTQYPFISLHVFTIAACAADCGLGAWTSNSQVVTAVSDTPLGPFVRHNVAIPPWSHNPEAIHTPDGKFVIFTLGPGKGKTVEKNCTSQADVPHVELSGTAHDTPPNRPPGPVNFTIHSADSPSGPWTATTLPVIGWTNLSWTLQVLSLRGYMH
eukprot:SAG31_NODE_198_length_20656_cov_5.167291_9_plen_313_part_00